ncbi:MAG: biotin--[acetyl-CoA-carboxylase] ligase [Bacteroidota bacterium]
METKIVGKKRIFLPEVDSTNSYAIKLLKNVKLEEGTLVFTDYQTQGRGQRGMVWNAEPASNLIFSFILKPSFLSPENYYYLYKIAALACYDTLAKIIDTSQFDIKIKWPNDILVNQQKIGGILIENSFSENKLQWSIVGVGINVNQKMAASGFNAVSMIDLNGLEADRNLIMDSFCEIFEAYYTQLMHADFEKMDALYFSHLLGTNEWCKVLYKGKEMRIKVARIHSNGLMVMVNEQAQEFEIDVKDITWFL